MSTPLSGLLASQLQPAEKKKVDAVVCEACQRVHLYSTSDWITLHGAWATGKPPQSRRDLHTVYSKSFGSSDNPVIVCNSDYCILKAMGRVKDD